MTLPLHFLDKYTLKSEKSGGLGIVYICDSEIDGNTVAIKMLKSEFANDERTSRRFSRECYAWLKLRSRETIVRAHRVHRMGRQVLIVLEYVENSLDELLIQSPFSEDKALRVGFNICDALLYATKVLPKFIHLDIKPGNILVDRDGRAKVTDFGLSKVKDEFAISAAYRNAQSDASAIRHSTATFQSEVMGTPWYMAPEQARGGLLDQRADIYAIGATLFHMVTSRPVHGHFTPIVYEAKLLTQDPPNPKEYCSNLSSRFCDLLVRCLSLNISNRPASYEQLRDEIHGLLRDNYGEPLVVKEFEAPTLERQLEFASGLSKLGYYDEALASCNALQDRPDLGSVRPLVTRLQGVICKKTGNLVDAVMHFREALEQARAGNRGIELMGILGNSLGGALYMAGQPEEALKTLQDAARALPDGGAIFSNLGDVLRELNRTDEAIEAYLQALELDLSANTCGKLALLYLNDLKEWRRCIEMVDRGLAIDRMDSSLYTVFLIAVLQALVIENTSLLSDKGCLAYLQRARNYVSRATELGIDPELATSFTSIISQLFYGTHNP